MTENEIGQSVIAAIGLLVNEEEITLCWFFKTFKKKIPNFDQNSGICNGQRHERKKCNKASIF
jgi:hypothetical protein